MVLISCFKNNKLLAYCLTVFFMHSSNRLLNILRILFVQISDLEADYEESQRNIQQLKKKAQRLTAELQDTKLHLEGQQSRNHDLEKKQRKSVHKHTQSSFTCHVITQFYYFTYLCLVPGRPISNGVITTVIVNKLQCFMCVCVYFWKVWQWAECSPGWGAEGEKPEGETGSRERRADRRGLRPPAAAGGLCLCGLHCGTLL